MQWFSSALHWAFVFPPLGAELKAGNSMAAIKTRALSATEILDFYSYILQRKIVPQDICT